MDDKKQQNGAAGNHDDGSSSGAANTDDMPQKIKKPKTEAQLARERERRKRRRKKKRLEARPGEDVPLFVSSDQGEAAEVQPPPDARPVEIDTPPDFGEGQDFVPAAQDDYSSNDVDIPEPPDMISPSEMDESQRIFEESPVYKAGDEENATPETESANAYDADVPVEGDDLHDDIYEEEKEKEEALKQATELSENLISEEPAELEEIPLRQGLMGRIFDSITGLSTKGKSVDSPKTVQTLEEAEISQVESAKGGIVLSKIIGFVFRLIVVLALIVAAFWIGSSLKLMDYFSGVFDAKQGVELNTGDNQQVVVDDRLLQILGFKTAQVLGENRGDVTDNVYNVFFNANYFGKLKDPVFYGETGVTSAIFFGFGRDEEFFQNKFVYYVKYLEKLNLANKVKIADVLDSKTRRDEALDEFILETTDLFERGNELRKEINVQIDDLKVSTNSLNPDKSRYEIDFFASLQDLEASKADELLKKFIDVTQKQVELKAKLAALSKLSEYYESVLVNMKLRLEAVQKNREALISGVTVTETPGVDLELIRE